MHQQEKVRLLLSWCNQKHAGEFIQGYRLHSHQEVKQNRMCCTNLIEKHGLSGGTRKKKMFHLNSQRENPMAAGYAQRKHIEFFFDDIIHIKRSGGQERVSKHCPLSHTYTRTHIRAATELKLSNIMLFVCVLGIRVTHMGVISCSDPSYP